MPTSTNLETKMCTWYEMFKDENPFTLIPYYTELQLENLHDYMLAFHGAMPIYNYKLKVVTQILNLFHVNYYKYKTLFNTMFFEYNPIENYRMVEEEDNSTENEGTVTADGTTTATATDSSTQYNDQTFSDVAKNETSGTNNSTTQSTGKIDFTKRLTRSGNIGVTTSQQMIESERTLAFFSFYEVIAEDIVNAISTKIYVEGDF